MSTCLTPPTALLTAGYDSLQAGKLLLALVQPLGVRDCGAVREHGKRLDAKIDAYRTIDWRQRRDFCLTENAYVVFSARRHPHDSIYDSPLKLAAVRIANKAQLWQLDMPLSHRNVTVHAFVGNG
ncbi:hypothetical protein PAAL109150_08305 [Paenibacillus alkaliterrae]